ncbi:hypothetical protein Vretifemale_9794, partial [Volvox reticuliferus]
PPGAIGGSLEGRLFAVASDLLKEPLYFLDLSDGGGRVPVLLKDSDARKYLGFKIRIQLAAVAASTAAAASSNAYPYNTSTAQEDFEALPRASSGGPQSRQRRNLQQEDDYPYDDENDISPQQLLMGTKDPITVEGIQVVGSEDPNAQQKWNDGVTMIKSVVYLISTCEFSASTNPARLRALFVNERDTSSGAVTMQNIWRYCSQGMVSMNSSTQAIYEVKVPCTGSLTTGNKIINYNFNGKGYGTCAVEMLGLMVKLADNYVRNTFQVSLTNDQQRILVLPGAISNNCGYAGAAAMGITPGEVYITGAAAENLNVYVHEMSHSYFNLQHSMAINPTTRSIDDEYGDDSCLMGRGSYCFNAPQLWKLNWVSPLPGGDLNGTTLTIGTPRTFVLPSQNKKLQSYLRIDPTWALSDEDEASPSERLSNVPAFFISHRALEAPFDNLFPSTSVMVYTFRGTKQFYSIAYPNRETVLQSQMVYRSPMPYGLVVRVVSIIAGSNATVVICRASGENENTDAESCSDGLDNDCDGRVDYEDPDCNNPPNTPPPRWLPPSPRPPKPIPAPRPPPKPRAPPKQPR